MYNKEMCKSCGIATQHNPSSYVWGPIMWLYLHNMATVVPGANIEDVVSLLNVLEFMIPCSYCSPHYVGYRNKHKLPSPATFQNIEHWLYGFHSYISATITHRPLHPFIHNIRVNIPAEKWNILMSQLQLGLSSKNLTYSSKYINALALFTRLKNIPAAPATAPV